MSFLSHFFKSSPFPLEITDQEEVEKKYKHWRVRILYSMFLGYVFYYFTRKGVSFAMPSLAKEFCLDKFQVGLMGSLFSLTYGISKFFSGVWSDQSNPRYFMAFGLILTGICNIFFGFSSSLISFVLFWSLNAWFQGFGWPPCVKLLSYWYSQSERGSWWSIWNLSHNVGGIAATAVITVSLIFFGWNGAMIVPGILCIFGGVFLLNRLADVPQSLGLPPIEKFRNDYPTKKEEPQKLSSKQLMLSVLKNKYIWVLAVAYFFVYFVRTGMADWTVFFMIDSKGYSQIAASGMSTIFDVGGILGALAAGWLSDYAFKAKRGPINALFSMLLVASIGSFWFIPAGYLWMDSCMIFMIGFATFGPQMLIGVMVAEFAHKQATATATGLAGWVAYLGSALAGAPLGFVIDHLSWNGLFICTEISAVCATVLLLPLWNTTKDTVLSKLKPIGNI